MRGRGRGRGGKGCLDGKFNDLSRLLLSAFVNSSPRSHTRLEVSTCAAGRKEPFAPKLKYPNKRHSLRR